MSADKVVDALIAGWHAMDPDAIAACFAEDGVWHNMPYAPISGRAAIAATVKAFLGEMTEGEFHVHARGEIAPGVIVTERTDVFRGPGGKTITIPVMGIFEIKDGLIQSWRDYFDAGVMTA